MQITRRGIIGGAAALLFGPRSAGAESQELLRQYLASPLWLNDLNYDSGHILMPALYAGSEFHLFAQHFSRFVAEDKEDLSTCHPDLELDRLHYIYLAATFCRLAHARQLSPLVPPGMEERLTAELSAYWAKKPATWYPDSMFRPRDGGWRELLKWKVINKDNRSLSYYTAIIDHELFAVCAMSELRTPDHEEAVALLIEAVRRRSVFTAAGGWIFQPGAWRDHPDYAYAGYTRFSDCSEPAPVDGIAQDSSHSHRWPLFLRSLQLRANYRDSAFLRKVTAALDAQFFNVVFSDPTPSFHAPRIRNYMDGGNGIYRYSYATTGSNAIPGYGPFMLSGILAEGWWGFLPSAKARWRTFAECFPLSEDVVRLYVGPNTTAPRHQLVKWPGFFTNGFAEMNVRYLAYSSH